MNNRRIYDKSFHILLAVVTIGLGWILLPFFSAVFWGAILALMFQPVQRWLTIKFKNKPNIAALTTLAFILILVILPLAVVVTTLIQEVSSIYQRIQSGQLNIAGYFTQAVAALPESAQHLLARYGLTDFRDLQTKLTAGAAQISQVLASTGAKRRPEHVSICDQLRRDVVSGVFPPARRPANWANDSSRPAL